MSRLEPDSDGGRGGERRGEAAGRPSEAGRRPAGPFGYADFRLLWLAGLSWTATRELRLLVVSFWLLEETGSAAQLGVLGAVQLAVQVPALLYGGTLADRVDRRRLLVLSQLVVLAGMGLLGLLDLGGALQPWHIYAGTAVMGASTVLGQPARGALIASVVPERQLVQAVTVQMVTQNASAVLAPLVFALVAVVVSVTAAFFATALIALPAVLLPALIRIRFQPPLVREDSSATRRTVDGFKFVRRHPILPGLMGLDAGVTVFSFYRQLYPLFARELYGGGAAAVGLLGTASAIGSIVGALLVLVLQRYRSKGMIVLYATLIYAALLFPLAIAPQLWMGLVLLGSLGMMDGMTAAMRQSIVHLTTPDQMRGRTLGLQVLAAQTANNVGTLEIGILTALVGLSATLVFGGAASLLVTVWIWRALPGIRNYRYP